MAFCPECGKAVTPDAAACVSCGKQLRADDKKLKAARFNGTMMMTAPEVKAHAPANNNAEAPAQPVKAVAAASGMGVSTRSSRPPSTHQSSNQLPHVAGPTLGRGNAGPQAKATMMGPGVSPAEIAQAKAANAAGKAYPKHATMIGASSAPTTPRSKPPGAALKQVSEPPPGKNSFDSARPPIGRMTTPQGSSSNSVRAVQSVPVSPSPAGAAAARPAAVPHVKTPAERAHAEAQTLAVPLARVGAAPDPARMVQAIPEVIATVVDLAEQQNARTVPHDYLPGDPMAPQPSAAPRAPRLRPFAPDNPEQEGQGNYVMLYWAVCVAVVAAVSALAFRLF
ncbi:MAG TPA: zinc ribbon domain-containing protein [Polyangiales bacterium]|nr:zinc ribbon domain-containing protein [Polyangiales bacterium]